MSKQYLIFADRIDRKRSNKKLRRTKRLWWNVKSAFASRSSFYQPRNHSVRVWLFIFKCMTLIFWVDWYARLALLSSCFPSFRLIKACACTNEESFCKGEVNTQLNVQILRTSLYSWMWKRDMQQIGLVLTIFAATIIPPSEFRKP